MKEEITLLGETTFRNQRKKFGIKLDDRRRHVYVIGKTGMGKTVLLENMAIQDIKKGNGMAFVDPHGEASEGLLDFIPSKRVNDVVYFNPADIDFPIAFNVMEQVDFRYRHLVAGGLMGVFKKVWPDVWSARMEYILNNTILALLEYPESTILGVNRMLADVEYREKVVAKVTDPVIKSFWVNEYARYTQRYEIEATAAIQNKVGQFVSNPLIRNIVGQVKSTIDMRKIMDEGKILILNLSKGRIGEDNSRLLGALLITKIQLAVMSRVDIPEEKRRDFYLYVDEFQNFATMSFANILSEARKYRLSLTLGHQYITQMEEEVRDAVFGNVGTLILFRIGAEDAEFLEREFMPDFTAQDLVSLTKYNIYLKLMIDGMAGRPFSAETLPPLPVEEESNREKIIKASRERYSVKREIVEDKIRRWTGLAEQQQQKPVARAHSEAPTLYDAQCSSCGKPTKVVFQPEKGRPVYCKNCLKKIHPAKSRPEGSPGGVRRDEQFNRINPTKPREDSPSRMEFNQRERAVEKPMISLKEAFGKEAVPFSYPRKKIEKEKPKRKEVDIAELRKALEESLAPLEAERSEKKPQGMVIKPLTGLEKKEEEGKEENPKKESETIEDKTKKGEIKPGETVKF
ncbi:type IV secretion system DNA-binding domain-containing protein [Patescibacteria group bacterium]|nr:type IV secretion system DNA-binding domain-containing protein [Patescibacteria group bacterium]MBU4274615.1 type IV secretion system DNA-binding domain-containing protein [Patescibacteria group bacterium]MBU4367661.1 type IV secretion system DNA-binding domain-containing protein [Patescibacteria group bacterium]MBU4461889.1 type IV secretion system DNA-binding domain-containing protein [Patescibacteria group bacterium]MCG2699980.1 type IV secretion system DNA-binding domain-containing prote